MMVQFLMERVVVVVMDQLHCTEIAWKHTSIPANVTGTFPYHRELNSLKWKRFRDPGSSDICIVPGIIAGGTTSGVSVGRMYNRAVHSWRDGGITLRSLWMKIVQYNEGMNCEQKWRMTLQRSQVQILKKFSEIWAVGKLQLTWHITGRSVDEFGKNWIELSEVIKQWTR